MEQKSQRERRHFPRFRCEGKAEIRAGNSPGVLWGTVTDLSAGGCYIELASPLPLDRIARLTLTFHGVRIEIEAKVAVVHPMFGMGLLFTSCSKEALQNLKGILAELAGSTGAAVPEASTGVVPAPPTSTTILPSGPPVPLAAVITPSSVAAPAATPVAAPQQPPTAAGTAGANLRISTQAAYTILEQVIKHLSQKGTLTRAEMLAILKQNQSR